MPADVVPVLKALAAKGDSKVRGDMAPRYGITAAKAWGVRMADIKLIAKGLGRNHALAEPLWATGWYEARLLVSMIADPAVLTAAQMDRWTRDFDNWAVCDTLCFNLFDRSPHAWAKVDKWATAKPEFVKRTAFALLASLALHDKKAPDEPFLARLKLIEAAATDERNFVKKGVN
jgi:3-methyladenine DNA glycosylase AlkD